MKSASPLACTFASLFLVSGLGVTNAQVADSTLLHNNKTDSIYILNGRLAVVLAEGSYKTIPTDLLVKKYACNFGTGKVLKSYGFVLTGKDTLRFYQTSIGRPVANDNGVSIWNLIGSFADKISDSYWTGSGWNKMGNDYKYFIKLIAGKKQFFEFNFFFLDDKLTFSLLQCPLRDRYFGDQENFKIISSAEPQKLE